MMNDRGKRVSWRFWLRWTLASILGLVVGMILFIAVGAVIGEALDRAPEWVFGLVIGIIFGTVFGIAHWLVLRQLLPLSTAWIWATIGGFLGASVIIFGLMAGGRPDTSITTKLGHGLVLGGGLGLTQWLVLRQKVGLASIWIGISMLAWLIAEIVGIGLSATIGPPLDLLGLFLVGSVLPGAGIIWLLNRAPGAIKSAF
jgi:hypothetical protein